MERCTRRLFVRISDGELNHAKQLADALDMSVSKLVRLLLESASPGATADAKSIIIVDRPTAIGLRMEMRRWGYHYNQAVHALNSIAYYLRLDEMDTDDVLEELSKANRKLEAMDTKVSSLRDEVAAISMHPTFYL